MSVPTQPSFLQQHWNRRAGWREGYLVFKALSTVREDGRPSKQGSFKSKWEVGGCKWLHHPGREITGKVQKRADFGFTECQDQLLLAP